jgi:single-strand DNA-binding protein
MVNKVILIGNAGGEPEVKDLESGAKLAQFSLATNENYRDKAGEWQQNTEWHRVVTWRTMAEKAERQVRKGTKIYLEGKLTTRKWQDKEGNDRYTTEVVANYFRVLDKIEGDGQQLPPMVASGSVASGPVVDKPVTNAPANEVEDDLPF